jgi:hypothetical protein
MLPNQPQAAPPLAGVAARLIRDAERAPGSAREVGGSRERRLTKGWRGESAGAGLVVLPAVLRVSGWRRASDASVTRVAVERLAEGRLEGPLTSTAGPFRWRVQASFYRRVRRTFLRGGNQHSSDQNSCSEAGLPGRESRNRVHPLWRSNQNSTFSTSSSTLAFLLSVLIIRPIIRECSQPSQSHWRPLDRRRRSCSGPQTRHEPQAINRVGRQQPRRFRPDRYRLDRQRRRSRRRRRRRCRCFDPCSFRSASSILLLLVAVRSTGLDNPFKLVHLANLLDKLRVEGFGDARFALRDEVLVLRDLCGWVWIFGCPSVELRGLEKYEGRGRRGTDRTLRTSSESSD